MITAGDAWNDLRAQQARQAEVAEKRRKHGRREEREGHDMRGEEPPGLTGAHVADEAALRADCAGPGHCEDAPVPAEAAHKSIPGLEADPGPGTFREPVTPPEPGAYDRPYLDAGHAAPSPQHQPPNAAPLPPQGRGILRPVELPGAPAVAGHAGPGMTSLAKHMAQAAMRPPIPPGRAQ
jgi:hypothetical protein